MVPGIPRRSPIQVLTRPAFAVTSENERDRVYSTEYGRIRLVRDLLQYILTFTSLKLAQPEISTSFFRFRIFQF